MKSHNTGITSTLSRADPISDPMFSVILKVLNTTTRKMITATTTTTLKTTTQFGLK